MDMSWQPKELKFRGNETLRLCFFCSLPNQFPEGSRILVLDPMLATGMTPFQSALVFSGLDVIHVHLSPNNVALLFVW